MVSLKSLIFGKSVIAMDYITEETREGVHKAYIPKWLFKPPYGYPRYANMPLVRWLAKTPYADMCITTIIDELTSIPWDIVIEPGFEDLYLDENGDIKPEKQKEIDHVKRFFENPNTNKETFSDVFIEMPVRDILEVNAGILNKVYNLKGDLVEVVAKDGSSFTKNPDIHGMFTDREDLIIPKTIVNSPGEVVNEFEHIHASRVREDAAYFQYGWIAGPMPIPFGKKEIIWLEKMKRTDEIYGYSPIQVLANSLQMLIWMIDSDLEYFNENNTPKGIIGLEDSDEDEIKAFRDQWYNMQRKKDEFGNYKKMMHKVPIVNKIPKFTRIEFSASEMQLIEKQKWYSKMVWAVMGVTGVELGYTEDAQGQANQIVQSKVFKKKAINPMLRKLSAHYNMEIVSEFEYEHLMFKFLVSDIDEERIKYELFKLQTESGLKTLNECRNQEGLDPLDWGDKPPRDWQTSENSWNVGFEKPMNEREKEAQETDDKLKLPKNKEETGKPKEESNEFQTFGKSEIKHKYIKRTGSPGNYTYWYRDPKTGKLYSGDTPSKKPNKEETPKPKQEVEVNQAYIESSEFDKTLEKRGLSKEQIEDSKYLAEDLLDVGAEINPQGYVKVYHRTSEGNKKKISSSGKMIGREDGIFFSTKQDGQAEGFGDSMVELFIPLEDLQLDDMFEDEAHVRIPTSKPNESVDISKYVPTSSKAEKKAVSTEHHPLILGENERPTGYKRLEKAILYVLKENEENIKKILESEMKENAIGGLKDINSVIAKIKALLSFEGLRKIIKTLMTNNYLKGWDEAEEQMDMNFVPDSDAIEYLSDYTFGNIKGMNDDIANKLRQELQRGFMEGEGITDIKDRVSKVFDVGENRAEMIARTESANAMAKGKYHAYVKAGVKMKKYISVHLDNRTSTLCKNLDRKYGDESKAIPLESKFKYEGEEWITNPFHIQCRSDVLYVMIEDKE